MAGEDEGSRLTSTSVWTATMDRTPLPALTEDLEVDIAVLGAGVIGLTTALLAQRADVGRVAVVEARTVGAGTTGSTTGKVTSQHGLTYAQLIDRHGVEHAQRYAEANEAGVARVAALAEENGIECDLTRAPAYVYTQDPSRREVLADEASNAKRLGLPATLTSETDLPLDVEQAVRFDDQLHLHAGRYLNGLAAAFTAAGGRLFEHTRALGVREHGDHATVRTTGGTVRAKHVVVATLLPIGLIGGFFARTTPTSSYALALRLREPAPRSMAISADRQTWSTRPWLDPGPTGLVVAGKAHETGTVADTEANYADLERWAREHFAVESVEYRWYAQDFATPDLMPYVGRSPLSRRTYVATGMRKWGLSNGTAAAVMLVDKLAGRPNPWLETFDAARVDGPRALAGMARRTLAVAGEFVSGHLRRFLGPVEPKLAPGQGGLVKVDGDTVGGYRDPGGVLHAVRPVCTHMGCPLSWNPAETSWDCACHGSRFDPDGNILDGPAVTPLKRAESD